MENTIHVMWGSHTFSTSSSKVNVFVYPTNGKGRDFPSRVFKAERPSKLPAAKDGASVHGQWYTQRLTGEENAILGVQLQSSYHAAPYASCMFLVQLRETGPYIRVRAKLSRDHNAQFEWLDAFEGRADVITLKEALRQNISIPPAVRKIYFNQEEIEEEFEVITIIPETTAKPKLATIVAADGGKKTVRIAEGPRRVIRVRHKEPG